MWTDRGDLPRPPAAGIDLNADGFNSDLVSGVPRNAGSRGLDLDAIGARRVQNERAPIDASQLPSARVNVLDLRVSKAIPPARARPEARSARGDVQRVERG